MPRQDKNRRFGMKMNKKPMQGKSLVTTGLFLPRGSKKRRRRNVGASLRINPPKQIRRRRRKSLAGCFVVVSSLQLRRVRGKEGEANSIICGGKKVCSEGGGKDKTKVGHGIHCWIHPICLYGKIFFIKKPPCQAWQEQGQPCSFNTVRETSHNVYRT